jgi:hypothetical protein
MRVPRAVAIVPGPPSARPSRRPSKGRDVRVPGLRLAPSSGRAALPRYGVRRRPRSPLGLAMSCESSFFL